MNQTKQDWEGKFEEKFHYLWKHTDETFKDGGTMTTVHEDVKDFIQSAISQREDEIIEGVEELPPNVHKADKFKDTGCVSRIKVKDLIKK